ncbi:Hypothetical protein CAP_1243 [Chondromyces apiculatus DSM 436]|uniref:Uncharacterized protein n=1 Tax=Chondromyces apiculatus DSM 436 TaxID=1192034 RepID=A0A017TCL0_9BACT|nr:Hypothetical protein CAP_1243 [Chondromyces apiculatus DSM 436]
MGSHRCLHHRAGQRGPSIRPSLDPESRPTVAKCDSTPYCRTKLSWVLSASMNLPRCIIY